MKKVLAAIGIILAAAILVLVGGVVLAENGVENPVSTATDNVKNSAINAAIDATGVKERVDEALRDNAGSIAIKAGIPKAAVDSAIDSLDIQSWQAVSLPKNVVSKGTTVIDLEGTRAELTTYSDPSIVTVDMQGTPVTMRIPASAQEYIQFLDYL